VSELASCIIHDWDGPEFPACDAWVFEEDTYRVLSADPRVRDPKSHPIRIMTGLHDQQPELVGTVLLTPGQPHRMLAVVHDLDQQPSCQEQWVKLALKDIIGHCQSLEIGTLATHALGCHFGSGSEHTFRRLLQAALLTRETGYPNTVFIVHGSRVSAPGPSTA
jgi:hypothetical protein